MQRTFVSLNGETVNITVEIKLPGRNLSRSFGGGTHDFVDKRNEGYWFLVKSSVQESNISDIVRNAILSKLGSFPSVLPETSKSHWLQMWWDGKVTFSEEDLLYYLGTEIEKSNIKGKKIERAESPSNLQIAPTPAQTYAAGNYPLKKVSRFRRFKRRLNSLGRRQNTGYRRHRIRKIHAFLILWVASFIVGYFLTSVNAILLFIVSLIDAVILFIPLFLLWWLFHKRIAGKIFAIFLIVIFAIYVYQTPSSFTKKNLTSDFYSTEASYLTSIYSAMSSNPSSGNVNNKQTIPTNSVPLISASQSSTQQSSAAINSQWVDSFIAYVNSFRQSENAVALTYSSQVSRFSQVRFNTMSSGNNYEISHFGFDTDAQSYFGSIYNLGEVVFYPETVTQSCIDFVCSNNVITPDPTSFASGIQANDPGHWQVLTDSSLTHYGFFSAEGPTYIINQGCPNTEIPGPNINITQFFEQQGCTFSIMKGNWLVIDLSS
ncbi:MAG: hypothetical protein JRN15_08020 [Nitrososphaerota archaeon]|nr:hypothetical protein [Nitrososphaerota archaeon]